MSTIKIPYAIKDGVLVHIDSVESGLACGCVCPVCSSPLLARKGNKNIHHFSHSGDSNCNPETVLHWLGKQFLFNRIKKSIDSKTELSFEWKCNHCYDTHKRNLTRKASSVLLEYSLGKIKPDITIFNSSGKPRIAIEVVVSHPPEPETIDYCIEEDVYLFTVNLKNEHDLYKIEHELLNFDGFIDYCPEQKKCPNCGEFGAKKYVQVANIECWRCLRPMKLAAFSSLGAWPGTSDFSEKDCAVAKELGAIMRYVCSKTSDRKYLASCCPHCGGFSGEFFFHDFINDLEKQDGKKVFTGYYCSDCSEHHFE